MTVPQIASRMATFGLSPEVQIRQTAFRVELAKAWGVRPGERLLEIGCGQGDTTAVLAASGASVVAVDPADPSYGAPVTLGDATRRLAESDLGARIEFRLGFDPLAASFGDDAFDAVVFAHCSWYFSSEDALLQTLKRVRPWAKRLFFSEWDLQPSLFEQTAHLLAVTIQSQVEAFKPLSEANVRTPLSRAQVRQLLEESGWRSAYDATVDSSDLDDGRWEVEACLGASVEGLPVRLQTAIDTQRAVLRSLSSGRTVRSLASYALVAERDP